ncbi:MAG: hypothetical protein ISS57_12650 [Anaerolineales bacterium]|nr:hypothetical protein [Anaerolineales bacterium]
MSKDPLEKIRRLKQTDEVWEGTTRLARMWISPKNADPYRSYHLIFVSDTDRVVLTKINNELPTPDQVCEALFKAMRRPALGAGRKRRPRVLALDDKELVQAITPRLAEIGVLCEYRSELPFASYALQELEQHVNRKFPAPPSLLSIRGVTIPLLGNIFTSAADFYRLAPWEQLQDETPIEIRYPAGAASRFVVVMGAAGESFGISVNDTRADLNRMFTAASPRQLIKEISWFTLTYDVAPYFSFDDLDTISRYDWPVVNEYAYPSMARVGPTPEFYLPTRQDLFWVEGALPVVN